MKNLSPVWFLKSPLDSEHKNYILLDFLKSVSEDIRKNLIQDPLREILFLIENLERFSKEGEVLSPGGITREEEEILNSYLNSSPNSREGKEIKRIIDTSLQILYKYSEGVISLWKDLEDRIKIYYLNPEIEKKDKGIIIFRNMSTNEIIPYWWKKTEIRIEKEFKSGVVLKKISIRNNYFSMSYEFILHEIMVHMGIKDSRDLLCTIIEISENFNQGSEIFKVAKEKFIKKIED